MRRILAASIVAIFATPSIAGACDTYVNASSAGDRGDTLVFADYLHFDIVRFDGEPLFTCVGTDDFQPRGPYAVTCEGLGGRAGYETEINYFSGDRGESAALLDGVVWFPACDST